MARNLRWLAAIVFVTAALFFVPSAAAAPAAAPAGSAGHAAAVVAPDAHAATANRILAALHAANVPKTATFLPNFHAQVSTSGGKVSPLYNTAPAPMGIGYLGVQKVHGVDVGSISYTSSVETTVQMNGVDPLYLASSSPDIFTMQLNTVLTHTTVMGDTSNQYWIQNVPIYYAQSQTLGFEDNIWNFSSPAFNMPTSTLYSYSGQVVDPIFYYAVGPSFHMPTPFQLRLYNNATVFNDRPTIYFNYSITNSHGHVIAGSFDRVEFNSTGLTPPSGPSQPPTFQINGVSANPTGFLLNDAEMMLGGPGGGSTTSIFAINATMSLSTLPNGTKAYKAVPAAIDIGTDTGETSEGIAEYAAGVGTAHPMAVLGAGPSLVYPLWGLVGSHPGFIQTTFHITPSNAFAFASVGTTFNPNVAGWAPVPASGTAVYNLPPNTYSFRFLLSDHNPKTATVFGHATLAINLPVNFAKGVYTPLWAWNNAQLAAISLPGGAGTAANPYVLDNNVAGPINPLFGQFNDYVYFVFPGIFLSHTTAYVAVENAPQFSVTYSLPAEANGVSFFGLPFTNSLEMQFYHAQHVSIVDTALITGWVFAENSYMSSVLFWDSSNNLIAGNTFGVQSAGVILAGGTNNVVWGNVFNAATTTAANPSNILYGSYNVALQVYESGDLVYNNAFLVPISAWTPGFDLYTGGPAFWMDMWNVTKQPATHVKVVNGFHLTGSILGLSWVGGNYWSSYGTAMDPYGMLPYNDGGLISYQGDFLPLLPFALYKVVFTETGLPSGTSWSVTLNGITESTTLSTLVFWDPSGTYAWTVAPVTGFTAHAPSGAVVVTTHNAHVAIHFT